ncbi:MAG: hypothetical protein GY730_04065 [bacterium]|nr:hypothetical protein [bacterium]
MKRLIKGTVFFLIIFVSSPIFAFWGWEVKESSNFIIYYKNKNEFQAMAVLRSLEGYRNAVTSLTGNNIKKTVVVVEDPGLTVNSYANPLTNKLTILSGMPGSEGESAFYQDWYRMAGVHELTHLHHLTESDKFPAEISRLFGNLYIPNIASPLWLSEGAAVYAESANSIYEGRLNSSYSRSIIAAKVKAQKLPDLCMMTYPFFEFPYSATPYTYGSLFFEYLAEEYGPGRFKEFIHLFGSNAGAYPGLVFPVYGIDAAARDVYGKDFTVLYKEWSLKVKEKYQGWFNEGSPLISVAGEKKYLNIYNGKLFFCSKESQQPAPFKVNNVYSIVEYDLDTKKSRVIQNFKSRLTLPLRFWNHFIYYTLADVRPGYDNIYNLGYGLVNVLYRLNLRTGKTEKLLEGEIRAFCVLSDGSVFYATTSKDRFGSDIWTYKSGVKKKVTKINYLTGEMASYQDNIYVVAKQERSSWGIHLFDDKTNRLRTVIDTYFPETGISVSREGILFTAEYEKKSSIYLFDLQNNRLFKLTENAEAFSGALNDKELFYTGMTDKGLDIFNIKTMWKECILPERSLQPPSFTRVVKASSKLSMEKNLSSLVVPYARIFPFTALGEDHLGLNSYSLFYDNSGTWVFNIETKMFLPLMINYSYYSTLGSTVGSRYIVYKSLQSGLSNLELSLTTDFNDRVIPVISTDFKTSTTSSRFIYKQNIVNGGSLFSCNNIINGNGNSLVLRAASISRFHRMLNVRGYPRKWYDISSGYDFGIDYIHKLMNIRRGFWNPNTGFGDLFGSIFIDYSSFDTGYLSYGYEFLLETGMFFRLKFVPRAGFAVNNNNISGYWNIGFNLN